MDVNDFLHILGIRNGVSMDANFGGYYLDYGGNLLDILRIQREVCGVSAETVDVFHKSRDISVLSNVLI